MVVKSGWMLTATVHRTNTFPLIHTDVVHLVVNLLGVTPMLERFEAEHGTLTSVALFFGREYSWRKRSREMRLTGLAFSTLPALMYVGVEKLLRSNTSIMGAR